MNAIPGMLRKLLLAALFLACTSASADGFFAFEPAGCGSITTINYTPRWVWITIYDIGQNIHLDYGYVAPFGQRVWKSGRYSCAGTYHVRGEVKNVGGTAQPGDVPNIFDTRVQVSGSTHTVWIKAPVTVRFTDTGYQSWHYDLSRFWWDTNDSAPEPAAFGEIPKIVVVNNSPAGLGVSADNSLWYCLGTKGSSHTFTFDQPGTYNIASTLNCTGPSNAPVAASIVGFSKTTLKFDTTLAVQEVIEAAAPAITVVNQSPWGVQFAIDGANQPCLMPKGNQTISVRGPYGHIVHATIVPGCNSRTTIGPFEVGVPNGNNNNIVAFHGGLAP